MKPTRGMFLSGLLAAVLGWACGPALAKPPVDGAWQKIENLAPVIGADGKLHTATCSGYPGTDPRFNFWAKRGSSKNLMVFFEGGGACWDNLTCTFPIANLPASVPQFFVPSVPPGTNPSNFDGILKAGAQANPVNDWSMVYIPYCTGDLHIGSATKQYQNVGHPVFPLPPTFSIQHRGFDNFMVVLDWIRKNVDKPQNVLVAGSSAGGYGAVANAAWLDRTFPQAHLYVVADASQGVTTPAFDQGNPGRNSWNIQLAPWVFGADVSLISGLELMRTAAAGLPKAKVAQFTTALDVVQIEFYGVMKAFYGPGGSCPAAAVDWYQQMSGQIKADASVVPNFRHYVAAGSYHTLLRSPLFYSEASAGPTFSEWIGEMLNKRGGTGGQGNGTQWDDVACPTCLIAWPCP